MKTFYLISILFLLDILVFTSCASLGGPEEGKGTKANIIFECGPTTQRPKHYPYIKTKPDWMKSPCVRFYDVTITNSDDIGYTILELKSIITYYKDGTSPFIFTYDQKKAQRIYITNYIEPYDSLVIKDRWVGFSAFNCNFPAKLVDKYKLLGDNGKIYIIKDKYSIE
jgi:hypothetical protein